MTLFQLLMLGASAFFAFKIYEHIQTLKDPEEQDSSDNQASTSNQVSTRTAQAFSTFDSTALIEKADESRENEDYDKALAIYSEANIKEPNNSETLFKMGYTLALVERDEEALEYFLDAIEQDDKNPFAYIEASKIYKKQGDSMKAEIFENKAREIDANI